MKENPIDGEKELLDQVDGEPFSSVTERRNPRIYIKTELVERLVKIGVPDDTQAIGHAVNSLAEMGISLGNAVIPDAVDISIFEKGLADRTEELTKSTIALGQILVELGAVNEYKAIFNNFKTLAKAGAKKGT